MWYSIAAGKTVDLVCSKGQMISGGVASVVPEGNECDCGLMVALANLDPFKADAWPKDKVCVESQGVLQILF